MEFEYGFEEKDVNENRFFSKPINVKILDEDSTVDWKFYSWIHALQTIHKVVKERTAVNLIEENGMDILLRCFHRGNMDFESLEFFQFQFSAMPSVNRIADYFFVASVVVDRRI